jgi:uridine kinase
MDSKKMCFLICGLPRSIEMITNNIETIFNQSDFITHFYICTSINDNNESQYFNKTDIISLQKQNINVKKLLIIKDDDNVAFRNLQNYTNKIKNGLKLIDEKYDLYFIIRSDCIISNTNFIKNITDHNKLYFSNENKNPFTKGNNDRFNEHIIISKSYETIQKLKNLYSFCCVNDNYCDINLYKFINVNNVQIDKINIDYKLILSKCNIIAISGDSGSGKSSLMEHLIKLYGSNALKLETDRYHKWERGNENYNKFTHLNPDANYLELMREDVCNLKIGNEIYQVDYDHSTGKFTNKCKIESKNNIILCGLHTLYNEKLNREIDLKIYMDTDRNLIKKWKIKRDAEERNYSIEKIIKQIDSRTEDYYKYIHNQKNNADIIINHYETCEDKLCCNMIINNSLIFNKLSPHFIKYEYSTKIFGDCVIVELKNDFHKLCNDEKLFANNCSLINNNNNNNNYYNEILAFIALYIYS